MTSAPKTAPEDKHAIFFHSSMVDLGFRVVLTLFFAFSAAMYIKNALHEFHNLDSANPHLDLTLSHALSILAIGLYTLMIGCLYAIRLKPIKTVVGWKPTIAALLGGFLLMGLLYLPQRTDLPLAAQIISCVLVLGGNIMAVIILMRLGKSFSILPQSRRLVTTGPYSLVRHPLYLAEAIATIGALINFISPVAVTLIVVQLGFQLVRMHYEEKILQETFPEYADYAKHTARLIPGIY
jgi:protein-S-isoprenylcysteine O-methyltransferase Ste14